MMGARYGQHFLRNRGAIETILRRFDPRPGDRVVEIGPGRGALTAHLAQRAGALAAVEIDAELARRLAGELDIPCVSVAAQKTIIAEDSFAESSIPPVLASASAGARGPGADEAGPFFILEADALRVRYADLARLLGANAAARLRVIGSLPYSVATALVRRMIAERHLIEDALFMVQREVADRLLAVPRTKAYGYLSVLVALTAERERVLMLQPGSFSPPPKVHSTVVALRFGVPDPGYAEADARLETLLKAAFSERRKKLAGNLAQHYGIDREEAAARLSACGVDPGSRAEELPPEAFTRLAAALPLPSRVSPG